MALRFALVVVGVVRRPLPSVGQQAEGTHAQQDGDRGFGNGIGSAGRWADRDRRTAPDAQRIHDNALAVRLPLSTSSPNNTECGPAERLPHASNARRTFRHRPRTSTTVFSVFLRPSDPARSAPGAGQPAPVASRPPLYTSIPLAHVHHRPPLSAASRPPTSTVVRQRVRYRTFEIGYILATLGPEMGLRNGLIRPRKKPRNSLRGYELEKAEGTGLEPATPFGAPHFQCGR